MGQAFSYITEKLQAHIHNCKAPIKMLSHIVVKCGVYTAKRFLLIILSWDFSQRGFQSQWHTGHNALIKHIILMADML